MTTPVRPSFIDKFSRLRSSSTITIVSPYLSLKAVMYLLPLGLTREGQLYTVFDLANFLSLSSDLRAIEYICNAGHDAYHVDGLHAKIFMSEQYAIVGSANATNRGLGLFGLESNIELLLETYPSDPDVSETLDLIQAAASPISHDMIEAMREAILSNDAQASRSVPWNDYVHDNWFPASCEMSDYFYLSDGFLSGIVAIDWEPLMQDLRYLRIPAPLGSLSAFKRYLASSVLREPIFHFMIQYMPDKPIGVATIKDYLPRVSDADATILFVWAEFLWDDLQMLSSSTSLASSL